MGRVLLVMGHRNTDPNATAQTPAERERTLPVVNHSAAALSAAGHTVLVLQREDGDNDPNTTTGGGRHFVAQRCTQLIQQHNIQVMIDCHFQSTPRPVSGCFCIFPDAPGDKKAMNPLDVNFATALAQAVSEETGIRRLFLPEPGGFGIMSETQTAAVSLAMFRGTVDTRATCVRVVMEHGDVQADRNTIDGPGFYAAVAQAHLRTVNQFFPVGTGIGTGTGTGSGSPFTPFQPVRLFHTHSGALGRKWASTTAQVLRRFERGEAIHCDGFYRAERVAGDDRWLRLTGAQPLRVHSSGVIETI